MEKVSLKDNFRARVGSYLDTAESVSLWTGQGGGKGKPTAEEGDRLTLTEPWDVLSSGHIRRDRTTAQYGTKSSPSRFRYGCSITSFFPFLKFKREILGLVLFWIEARATELSLVGNTRKPRICYSVQQRTT